MFLRLFENFVKFPFYSLSLREIRHYSPRFPLRGKWRAAPIEVYLKFRLMLRLPLASFCYRKNQQKLSAATRLPLGGRLRREAVVRGATCFLSELFQSKVATCSSASRSSASRFPLWEPLSNCRFKAISASKVARSADRGQPLSTKQSPL